MNIERKTFFAFNVARFEPLGGDIVSDTELIKYGIIFIADGKVVKMVNRPLAEEAIEYFNPKKEVIVNYKKALKSIKQHEKNAAGDNLAFKKLLSYDCHHLTIIDMRTDADITRLCNQAVWDMVDDSEKWDELIPTIVKYKTISSDCCRNKGGRLKLMAAEDSK